MRKLLKALVTLIGGGIGIAVAESIRNLLAATAYMGGLTSTLQVAIVIGLYIVGALIFGIIFFILSEPIIAACERLVNGSEAELRSMNMTDILFGCGGLLLGLTIAFFISKLIEGLVAGWWAVPISLLVYIVLGYLGTQLLYKRWRELPGVSALRKAYDAKHSGAEDDASGAMPKVLDTSVIIDGRIFDICETGFVEGPLVIPGVVLKELRHIADAADALKRNRGRRGLDVLQRIQKELDIEVVIDERDFDDVDEVDVKILKLAQALKGCVVTNDYNLNKVAGVSGIKVLNVNDLANAVKPVVIPGEEMRVLISKEGKEAGQGVAYLDDGTMIVIDNARRMIGETLDVIVTSVLQTSAGRMIFAKLKNA